MFCGGPGPRTEEHSIPSWVEDCLPGDGGTFTHERSAGGTWTTAELSFTVARVCEPCNTGWMSRLEDRAKPLLCDVIEGAHERRNPRKWNQREQRIVATWMFKTAITCDISTGGGSRIPAEHARFLFKKHHPPGRARIWTCAHAVEVLGDNEQARFGNVWPYHLTFHLADGSTRDGYSVTVSIGYLAFQVVGYLGREHLNPQGRQAIPSAAFEIQIWPSAQPVAIWPAQYALDIGGLRDYADRWSAK